MSPMFLGFLARDSKMFARATGLCRCVALHFQEQNSYHTLVLQWICYDLFMLMVPLWGLIGIRRTGSVPKLPTTSRPVGPVGPCSSVPKQGSAHPPHLATKFAWLWPIKWLKLHMYMGRLLGKETIATYIHFRMLRVPPWKSCICTSFMRLFACQKLEILIYLFFSCLFFSVRSSVWFSVFLSVWFSVCVFSVWSSVWFSFFTFVFNLFFHLQTSPEKNENKTKSKTDLKKC